MTGMIRGAEDAFGVEPGEQIEGDPDEVTIGDVQALFQLFTEQ